MDEKVFNPEKLLVWREVDSERWQELVEEILIVFFEECDRHYRSLGSLKRGQNTREFKLVAHSMKSCFGNVGAEKAYSILHNIEQLIDNGESDKAFDNLAGFDEVYAQTLQAITGFRDRSYAA